MVAIINSRMTFQSHHDPIFKSKKLHKNRNKKFYYILHKKFLVPRLLPSLPPAAERPWRLWSGASQNVGSSNKF